VSFGTCPFVVDMVFCEVHNDRQTHSKSVSLRKHSRNVSVRKHSNHVTKDHMITCACDKRSYDYTHTYKLEIHMRITCKYQEHFWTCVSEEYLDADMHVYKHVNMRT